MITRLTVGYRASKTVASQMASSAQKDPLMIDEGLKNDGKFKITELDDENMQKGGKDGLGMVVVGWWWWW